MVLQFFRNFDALNGVMVEILSADTVGACAGPSSQSTPVVIMSTYRDNADFAMVAISPLLEASILFIIEKITELLYSIPLKWEPHGQVTTWGEASMILHPQPTTVQHVV